MENTENKRNNVKIIAIVLLIIAIITGVVLFFVLGKNEEKPSVNPNGDTNPVVDNPEVVNLVESGREKFKKEVTIYGDKYTDFFGNEHSFDIDVPYINLEGENVEKINKEILNLYQGFVDQYNECYTIVPNQTDKLACTIESHYIYTEVNNIISIVITKKYSDNLGVYNDEYYTFNVEKTTGERYSYDDLLKNKSYTRNDVKAKAVEEITRLATSSNFSVTDSGKNKTSNEANDTHPIYLTSDGKLNIVCNGYLDSNSNALPIIVVLD